MQSLTIGAFVLLSRIRARPGRPARSLCGTLDYHNHTLLRSLIEWQLVRVGVGGLRPLYATSIGHAVTRARLERSRRVPSSSHRGCLLTADLDALAEIQQAGAARTDTLSDSLGARVTRLHRMYALWMNGLVELGADTEGHRYALTARCSETGLDLLARLDRLVLPEMAAK